MEQHERDELLRHRVHGPAREALSGSQSTGALNANASYTLTCTGAGGSVAKTATVTVAEKTPNADVDRIANERVSPVLRRS